MRQSAGVPAVIKGCAVAAGIIIAILGVMTGAAFLLQLIFTPDELQIDGAAAGISCVILGIVMGAALAWQGGQALAGKPSAVFRLPGLVALAALYIFALVVGQLLLSFNLIPLVTFPLFHILAAIIPPLFILTFAVQRLASANFRWRDMIVQLTGGAFLATSLAFFVEIFLGIAILLITFFIAALTPGGNVFLQELGNNLQDPVWLENPANLQGLMLFPPVFITIALVFIVVAPLTEEAAKLLGVTLMSYRQPKPAQFFGWGLAAGAGFALVENLFNTVLALDVWVFVMLLRIGGTGMHCLGAGLSSLGWHNFLTTRRPWRLLGAYAVAVVIHALWNGAVITMAGVSIFAVNSPGQLTLTLVGLVVLLMLALLIGLTIAIIAALVIVTIRLRNAENYSMENGSGTGS